MHLRLILPLGMLLLLGTAASGGAQQHETHTAATPVVDSHAEHGTPKPAPTAPSAEASTTTPKEEARVPIEVPAVQQSRIGLLVQQLERRRVQTTLRTVAVVSADQSKEAHVHTRVTGWIDEIFVSTIGAPVKKGEILYRLYSPEIVSTQQEYVAAQGQGELGKKVAAAALGRLRLWGVSPNDIAELEAGGAPRRALAFPSPTSGAVIDKMAVQGMYATPDMELYRIADLTTVWVVASLYETELPFVKVGDPVQVSLPAEPGKAIAGTISFLYPELDVATRTGRARVELSNRDGALKPGMYATVTIAKDLGEVVVVPADAVIDTGLRKIVFAKIGEARFEPRAVTIGPRIGDAFVLLDGVSAGEAVVVRASFLIDAESRLQAALKSGGAPQGHGGHGGEK